MSFTGDIYGFRKNGKSHGDVFTTPEVVRFMLDLIGYTADKDLSRFRILEPSFGQGDFLFEIQRRIAQSATTHDFDYVRAFSENVCGCELDPDKYEGTVNALRDLCPGYRAFNLKNEDFLFTKWNMDFDFIVGNPPYVRYENIPSQTRESYKSIFRTFHYRCDLYVLFYEHSLAMLKKEGRHSFICSNRWIKNEYGRKLRATVCSAYHLDFLIDIEGLNPFHEAVLAYPAITVISNTALHDATQFATIDNLNDLRIPISTVPKQLRCADNWDNLFLEGSNDLFSIEEQGFSIGIGVATGADKILIGTDLKDKIEDELLLPVINSRDLSGDRLNWRGEFLINPYRPDGALIDLDDYPKAHKYLDSYRHMLEQRHIVRKGRCWYSLIDKIKPSLKSLPKILLPDISGNRRIFVDNGLFYPAHNIYYVIGHRGEDLEVLAAILMSDFARKQIKNLSNKMNGGFPRWQSQNLRRLRIPFIRKIQSKLRSRLLDAYRNDNQDSINLIVEEIIGSQREPVSKSYRDCTPISLFDFDFEVV